MENSQNTKKNEIMLKNSKSKIKEDLPLEGWKKWLWIGLAIVSGVYIFFPEPTDAFPIIGWLDEGIAVFILTYALSRLGIQIPILDQIINRKLQKKPKH